MAKKPNGTSPWSLVQVTFKLSRPRPLHRVIQVLNWPKGWQFARADREYNDGFYTDEQGDKRMRILATSFVFTAPKRPSTEEGELVLAKLNMLPEQ